MSIIKTISAKQTSNTLDSSNVVSFYALYELTKPRLSLLTVFTAALGFLLHKPLQNDWLLFVALLLGTAFAAGGVASLNQWMERKEDSKMARTASRPLPSNLISPRFAFVYGVILSSLGLLVLGLGTNIGAMSLTFATLVIYLFLYTPLKKVSPYATEIGAVSGALPPLIGWVAAAGVPSPYGWILFGILFTWQLPHFMAIAWNFRDDYNKGGFKLHQLGTDQGRNLALKSLFYTFLLTFFVFSPYFLPTTQGAPSSFYLFSAILLSIYLFIPALKFFFSDNKDKFAKKLFFVTIIYLPLLLATLVIDRYL